MDRLASPWDGHARAVADAIRCEAARFGIAARLDWCDDGSTTIELKFSGVTMFERFPFDSDDLVDPAQRAALVAALSSKIQECKAMKFRHAEALVRGLSPYRVRSVGGGQPSASRKKLTMPTTTEVEVTFTRAQSIALLEMIAQSERFPPRDIDGRVRRSLIRAGARIAESLGATARPGSPTSALCARLREAYEQL